MAIAVAALPIVLYVVALVLGLAGISLPFGSLELHPLTQWMLVLSLAVQSLWAAFGHIVWTERVATSIGWAPSPFQIEIGGANLGIGVGALVAAVLGHEAAWTITFVAAAFLWSAAAVHVREMIRNGNFAINNCGPVFWWDILTPLTLIYALF